MKEGDFALIRWNGNQYTKEQHYHVEGVYKNEIHVRVPGSQIKLIIKKKHVNNYEIKQIKKTA